MYNLIVSNSHQGIAVKKQLGLLFAVAVSLLMVGGPLSAHHGNAAYDEKNPITVKGTVTEFAWENPHVQVYFDAKDEKGNIVHWSVETLSPGKLVRCGWTKDGVKAGDSVAVTLDPAKTGAPVGFLRKFVFANGKELGLKEQ
jgi:Family of unknown function (DUF6152)